MENMKKEQHKVTFYKIWFLGIIIAGRDISYYSKYKNYCPILYNKPNFYLVIIKFPFLKYFLLFNENTLLMQITIW